mgnify:CR=1 FL=1
MVQLPHQHGKNPSYVLEDMPKDGDFSAVSEIFHSVSDPKRLKLFWLLCHYEECVINCLPDGDEQSGPFPSFKSP